MERKKYGMIAPKIAESEVVSLGNDMCGSGESIYNKGTSQNTLSFTLLALTMIDPAIGWTNNSATSIQENNTIYRIKFYDKCKQEWYNQNLKR
jgi:hypothetical protein